MNSKKGGAVAATGSEFLVAVAVDRSVATSNILVELLEKLIALFVALFAILFPGFRKISLILRL